jgi:hypothetical protein
VGDREERGTESEWVTERRAGHRVSEGQSGERDRE